MVKDIFLFFLLLNCLFVTPALAGTKSLPEGDFSGLRKTGTARVTSIIDPQTVQLDTGDIVRLAGLDFPDLYAEEPGAFSLMATRILEDLLKGKTVALYQTAKKDEDRINRMGQKLAHLERQPDKVWVQGALISLGLARVKTTRNNPDMAPQMLDLEKAARKEPLGIWESSTRILKPEELDAFENSFQIIEGTVQSVALKSNRIYLNFGKDWKTDFTVTIQPEHKRRFSKQNLDPLQWGGHHLRVRGWIKSLNGPAIDIDHPESIETIGQAQPNPASSVLPAENKLPIVEKDN